MQNLIIIGSGGHANSCLDVILSSKKYKVKGYISKKKNNNLSKKIKWIGNDSYFKKLNQNDNILIGFANIGKRNLQNLSAVGGAHRNFRISPRITTSTLILGVYSPFTQYYEGKWWDPGVLIVPFSSWDIKITKTFKYNISFTGVWHSNGNALNYQILTGGKIRF